MGSGASSKYLAAKHSEVIGSTAGSHIFYFISADRLREFCTAAGSPALPCHQELSKREGWLIKRCVDFYTLLKGGYDDMAMISHRWVTPAHPDPQNEQLAKMQEFLQDNPRLKMVWYDYACIPQGRRERNHEHYFRSCLEHISLLYLTLPVMIIYDKQYGSRFWCNLEMYLSLRAADEKGIGPASDEELESQFHFYCVGSAQRMSETFKAAEVGNWKDRSVSEAAELLREEDIMVTNQRDKDTQLEKLSGLELRIKEILIEKEGELQGMSQRRLEQLRNAKSNVERLSAFEERAATFEAEAAELKKALDFKEKALEEAKLEIAGMKELVAGVPDRQELDKEVKALEAFSGLEISVDPVPHAMNVWSTNTAFLAKLKSGKAIAWGDAVSGGNLAPVQATLDSDGIC